MFNYGEPLLSPDLPRMIHEIHSRGMIAIISSNLSLEYNFDSLLIDPPDIFKISISGFSQKVYETTHNGGNIYLVKSNMYRIRMIEDKLKTRVNVVVGYHVYNNNQGAEYIAAEDLCKELGFLFQPRKAIFCNIPKQAGIDPFSKSDIEFISEYYPNSRDILTINQSKETISGTCRNALNRLFIDYNGDVFLCFMVMHNGGIYKSWFLSEIDIRIPTNYFSDNNWRRVGICGMNAFAKKVIKEIKNNGVIDVVYIYDYWKRNDFDYYGVPLITGEEELPTVDVVINCDLAYWKDMYEHLIKMGCTTQILYLETLLREWNEFEKQ